MAACCRRLFWVWEERGRVDKGSCVMVWNYLMIMDAYIWVKKGGEIQWYDIYLACRIFEKMHSFGK